jgi:hypothetical protein
MRKKALNTLACLTSERHAEAARLLAEAEDALLAAAACVDHPSYAAATSLLLHDVQMRLVDPLFTAWLAVKPISTPNAAPYRRTNYRATNMWADRPAPDGSDPMHGIIEASQAVE